MLEYVRESQERFDEFCVKQVCFGIVDTISATDFYTDSRAKRTPEAATVGEHTPTPLSSRQRGFDLRASRDGNITLVI